MEHGDLQGLCTLGFEFWIQDRKTPNLDEMKVFVWDSCLFTSRLGLDLGSGFGFVQNTTSISLNYKPRFLIQPHTCHRQCSDLNLTSSNAELLTLNTIS